MATTYPKMKTGTASDGTGRVVPLIYPFGQNHAKQGTFVIFNSAAEENSYDGTGVTTSASSSVWENRHHN